jgi:hypothetical protein
MRTQSKAWVSAFVLGAAALLPSHVVARQTCQSQDGCPPSAYSPLHYWLPSLYTFRAYHQPKTSHSYLVVSPETQLFMPYRCPSAPASDLYYYGLLPRQGTGVSK